MKRIKMKRKTAIVVECATSFIAYALFAWIDWRLFIAMLVLEIANGLSDNLKKEEK